MPTAKRAPAAVRASLPRPSWLGWLLAASCVSLFFQLFPAVWWSLVSAGAVVLSYVDVRTWTWRSYAVVCGVASALLIVMKGRQDSA